jgi:hypothetical protein
MEDNPALDPENKEILIHGHHRVKLAAISLGNNPWGNRRHFRDPRGSHTARTLPHI